MAIRLGGDTNITLTNTSFRVDSTNIIVIPLFTATSDGTYHFEGNLLDNPTMAVSFNINSTPKEIWEYHDGLFHHVTYESTLVAGDIVTLQAVGVGAGHNLTVTRYADDPKEIFVGEGTLVDDYSAMRGPCPVGFHVPSKDEWVILCGILTTTLGLPSNGDTIKTYLKMPYAGYRSAITVDVSAQGGYARYWSSSYTGTDNAYYLSGRSVELSPQSNHYRASGYSLRGFKDEAVIPDNSWTTLYDGSSVTIGAGVFHSITLGLISISGDGANWITISDKNVGATTVYNNGDALSESNCGKYYQRGNNYGFARTGNLSTSPTQVDATGYGPGNYYSSSIFVFRTSSPYGRDSSNNRNLRGIETGVQQRRMGNVKEVYVGTTKVRPSSGQQQQSGGSGQGENNGGNR